MFNRQPPPKNTIMPYMEDDESPMATTLKRADVFRDMDCGPMGGHPETPRNSQARECCYKTYGDSSSITFIIERMRATHRQYLALKARSIFRSGAAAGTSTGAEGAIQNLSSILEQQVTNVASAPQPARSLSDAFPPPTKTFQPVHFRGQPGRKGA